MFDSPEKRYSRARKAMANLRAAAGSLRGNPSKQKNCLAKLPSQFGATMAACENRRWPATLAGGDIKEGTWGAAMRHANSACRKCALLPRAFAPAVVEPFVAHKCFLCCCQPPHGNLRTIRCKLASPSPTTRHVLRRDRGGTAAPVSSTCNPSARRIETRVAALSSSAAARQEDAPVGGSCDDTQSR
jgi:hypothetical protein